MKRSSITIELNMPKILNKVENDKFGKALAKEWAGLVKQFVPHTQRHIFRRKPCDVNR